MNELPSGLEREATERILEALARRDETLAVAESCTGGLLGAAVTAVPGASRVFRGGVVAYDDDAKVSLLGVDPLLVAEHGAVSEPVARHMAAGARTLLEASWAVAITGIAGPGGGAAGKPVGTVWLAVDGARSLTTSQTFEGGRQRVRAEAVRAALRLLWRALDPGVGGPPAPSASGTERAGSNTEAS
ncbi:MAG: CinA family protein [Gemmatimonadota bacterium]